MPLLPLAGHLEARARLSEAVRSDRLPQTLLLTGEPGVGKQRLGLWLAQLLVCQSKAREPCGTCPPCRRVLGLGHSDVHWFVPIPRPKASDPDKAVDEAAQSLGEVMTERRETGLWTVPDGMSSHGVAVARLILRQAGLTAAEGGAKVFLIGDAERLVPQESSPEAANALLKVIEEPPRATTFILTASDPTRLLPTIRSRAVVLRLGRLSADETGSFLGAHLSPPLKGAALEDKVRAAGGSIGAALMDDGAAAKARTAAVSLLEAVLAGKGQALERAMKQAPWQARGDFSTMLDAMADALSGAARARIEKGGPVKIGAARLLAEPEPLALAVTRIQEAREIARGNVNPQVLMAVLAGDLEELLCA